MTHSEQADLIRSLHRHRGWLELHSPIIKAKMDHMKDQLLRDAEFREPDIKNWSLDKFAGFVLGLGWGHDVLADWLIRYDNEVNQAAVVQEEQKVPEPAGHPYASSAEPLD